MKAGPRAFGSSPGLGVSPSWKIFLAPSELFVVLLVDWSSYYPGKTAFEQGWGYLAFPLPPLLSPVLFFCACDTPAALPLKLKWGPVERALRRFNNTLP